MRLAALSLTRNLQTKLVGSNTTKINAANRAIANYAVNNSSSSMNSEKRKYTTYSQLPSEHQMVYVPQKDTSYLFQGEIFLRPQSTQNLTTR